MKSSPSLICRLHPLTVKLFLAQNRLDYYLNFHESNKRRRGKTKHHMRIEGTRLQFPFVPRVIGARERECENVKSAYNKIQNVYKNNKGSESSWLAFLVSLLIKQASTQKLQRLCNLMREINQI
jgi:hypothetical protein